MDNTPMQPPPASPLPRARRPETAQDWEPHKDMIANLYRSMDLRKVMKIMKDQHRLPYMISPTAIKLYSSKSSLTTYP